MFVPDSSRSFLKISLFPARDTKHNNDLILINVDIHSAFVQLKNQLNIYYENNKHGESKHLSMTKVSAPQKKTKIT